MRAILSKWIGGKADSKNAILSAKKTTSDAESEKKSVNADSFMGVMMNLLGMSAKGDASSKKITAPTGDIKPKQTPQELPNKTKKKNAQLLTETLSVGQKITAAPASSMSKSANVVKIKSPDPSKKNEEPKSPNKLSTRAKKQAQGHNAAGMNLLNQASEKANADVFSTSTKEKTPEQPDGNQQKQTGPALKEATKEKTSTDAQKAGETNLKAKQSPPKGINDFVKKDSRLKSNTGAGKTVDNGKKAEKTVFMSDNKTAQKEANKPALFLRSTEKNTPPKEITLSPKKSTRFTISPPKAETQKGKKNSIPLVAAKSTENAQKKAGHQRANINLAGSLSTRNTSAQMAGSRSNQSGAAKQHFSFMKSPSAPSEFLINPAGQMDMDTDTSGDLGQQSNHPMKEIQLKDMSPPQLATGSGQKLFSQKLAHVARQSISQGSQSSSVSSPATQWKHHRFKLQNGKAIHIAARSSDGALQLQLNTGNGELSKMLHQHLHEIQQHVQQQLNIEIDLQLQDFGGRQPNQESETASSKQPKGESKMGDNSPAVSVHQPAGSPRVRYFGFNNNEWTA